MPTPTEHITEERRRAERRPLLDQFYLAAVLPDLGPYRLKVVDVSDLGIGFCCNSREIESWRLAPNDNILLHLFLNQRIFLPLRVRVAQLSADGKIIRVGAEILKSESEGYDSLLAFIQVLDTIPASVRKSLSILR